MENGTVFSVSKLHTFSAIQNLNSHITRDEATAANIDKNRMYLNKEYVSTGGISYNEAWKNKIKMKEVELGHPIKVRKNAVLALELITGFSREMTDKIDADEWAKANVKWVEETFGKDNILSATLHLDESSPHMHIIVVPFNKEGRLSAKSYTAGKLAMANLWNSYGKAMEPFGLRRGRKRSKAPRKMLDKFYQSINDIEKIKAPAINPMESLEDYLARVEEDMKTYALATLNLKKQLEEEKLNRDEIITEKMSKYSEAINLYNELDHRYNGDTRMVKTRINTYRKIEMAAPKPFLQKVLDEILQKFPIFRSREYEELDEKKKKNLMKDFYADEKDNTVDDAEQFLANIGTDEE